MNTQKLPEGPPARIFSGLCRETEQSKKLTELWRLCLIKNDYTEYLEEKAKYDTNSKTS